MANEYNMLLAFLLCFLSERMYSVGCCLCLWSRARTGFLNHLPVCTLGCFIICVGKKKARCKINSSSGPVLGGPQIKYNYTQMFVDDDASQTDAWVLILCTRAYVCVSIWANIRYMIRTVKSIDMHMCSVASLDKHIFAIPHITCLIRGECEI